MQRLFRCLSALVLTIITTPVSLKQEKPSSSFTTSRWSPLCLWQKVILPGRFFQIWPLMPCHFTEGSHNTCPPGPLAVMGTWLHAPSNDCDFHIFLLRMKEEELHMPSLAADDTAQEKQHRLNLWFKQKCKCYSQVLRALIVLNCLLSLQPYLGPHPFPLLWPLPVRLPSCVHSGTGTKELIQLKTT